MAEGAVQILVGKIVTLLENEASLLGGLRQEFHEIQRELEGMKSFLKDADRRKDSSDGVRTWVEQVRDSAYDVEDIIDEFMYYIVSSRPSRDKRIFMGCLLKIIRLPKDLSMRHSIATRLQEIKTQIQAISKRSQQYNFDHLEAEVSSSVTKYHHGESSLFLKDDEIVGIVKDREILLSWLLENEVRRTVISVFGMGGSGKTTLVAKVYKSEPVKRHFDCCAWITVSQNYVIEDLFRSMIEEFFESNKEESRVPLEHLSTLNYRRLVEMLVDYLQQKRYIIVLDDVWSTNVLREISVALADSGRGSRVILTTRKQDVASFSFGVKVHVHKIQPLQPMEAWSLFCKKAFSCDPNKPSSSRGYCCPPELKAVAEGIVGKCEGLPLAIVTLGGLMSSKPRTDSEWKKVYNSMNWELSNNDMLEVVKSILLLSYNDLPYYLKYCFLYCCVFPEDFHIKRSRLIRLWIAEGFVEERKGMTIEEVADTYLTELISRSMIHVMSKNYLGMPKRLVMHDLMRELALSTSEKENFCTIYENNSSSSSSSTASTPEASTITKKASARPPRRLSVQSKYGSTISMDQLPLVNMSRIRSFFMFVADTSGDGDSSLSKSSSSLSFSHGFRLLRVLDLKGVPITSVPDQLTELFNLRYLNLKNTNIRELPKSIGRLQNLLTLNIVYTMVEALPNGIVELQNLRHIFMYSGNKGSTLTEHSYIHGNQVPADVWKLRNLQVLAHIKGKDVDVIKQVGNMTQLKRIGITNLKEANGVDLCSTIEKLNLLDDLFLMANDDTESLQLDSLSHPPTLLQKLNLTGKLDKVPHWFSSLNNLTSLWLHWSRLSEDVDPLSHIHGLPCLVRLVLSNAFEGRKLWFRAGWFMKLNILGIRNLTELSEVIIEKGAMPNLENLDLERCKNLKMVPSGIAHLTKLKKLVLTNMTPELIEGLRRDESIDRPKVRQVPEIDNYREIKKIKEIDTYNSLAPI